MKYKRRCECGESFWAKEADIKRGWGNSCSKSCAAKRREKKTGKFKQYKKSKDDGHFVGGYDHDFDN